jgi:hypothetical protein
MRPVHHLHRRPLDEWHYLRLSLSADGFVVLMDLVKHLRNLVPDLFASCYYLSHLGIRRTNYQQSLEPDVWHYQQLSL